MSKLHSQLALFGAIDHEVTAAKASLREGSRRREADADEAVIELVEGFLPGTTGFGQDGWYDELVSYLRDNATTPGSEGVNFPDLDEAIDDLQESTSEDEEDERDPTLARASYGAVVLEKIYRRRQLSERANPLRILGRALGAWPQEPENGAENLIDRIDEISNRGQWLPEVRRVAGEEFAERSRPCLGSLRKADGQYCAYITTEATDKTLTVANLAKVVEPINWCKCCKFFCGMKVQNPEFTNPQGWSRIVERISGECDKYYIDTNLLFWKDQLKDGSIYINYDIDPDRTGDSGLVEVDSGYIWINSLGAKGVRIRTSKLERVSGLSPTATAALACLMGWGDTGHEMLAGTARKYINFPTQPDGIKAFRKSPRDQDAYKG